MSRTIKYLNEIVARAGKPLELTQRVVDAGTSVFGSKYIKGLDIGRLAREAFENGCSDTIRPPYFEVEQRDGGVIDCSKGALAGFLAAMNCDPFTEVKALETLTTVQGVAIQVEYVTELHPDVPAGVSLPVVLLNLVPKIERA